MLQRYSYTCEHSAIIDIIGASNGTSGLSSEGTTGRVLLIVLEVVAVLAWVVSAVFVASMCISQLREINC